MSLRRSMSSSDEDYGRSTNSVITERNNGLEPVERHSRYALPVPILRGAKYIHTFATHCQGIHPTGSSRTDQTLEAGPLADHRDPPCATRTCPRGGLTRLGLEQTSEISRVGTNVLRRREAASEPNLDTATLCVKPHSTANKTSLEGSQTTVAAQNGIHSQTESRKYQTIANLTLPRDTPHQTPIVVNRVIPEYSDPFSKPASLDLKLSSSLQRVVWSGANSRVLNGGSGSSGNPVAKQIETTSRIPCSRGSEDEVQYRPCNQFDLCGHTIQEELAITASASNKPANVDAAEPPSSHHQVGTSIGYHSRLDTTNWATSTVQHTAIEDGSNRPPGLPSTPQLRLRPPLHPSPLQTPPEKSWVPLQPSLRNLNQTASTPKPQLFPNAEIHRLPARSAMLETCPAIPLGPTTIPAMIGQHCKRDDQAGSGMGLLIPSVDIADGESSPASPDSDGGSGDGEYETPMTSPSPSPVKERSGHPRFLPLEDISVQFDGAGGSSDENKVGSKKGTGGAAVRTTTDEDVPREALETTEDSDAALPHTNANPEIDDQQPASRSEHRRVDLTLPEPYRPQVTALEPELHEITPLVPASPAKSASTFPFPPYTGNELPSSKRLSSRYPSALLGHSECHATPRQRRLMTGGVQTPDRFISSRGATPSKETFMLVKPKAKNTVFGKREPDSDPFGPVPRRSLRMAERYATIRHPPPVPRAVGMIGTRVQDLQSPSRRAASAGSIWTVGGSIVTEGVASITNGRGGRVTSGTSAPHYTADFLRRNSPSEEEVTHGRRLALAMDIDQGARMLEHSSPSSSGSPQSRDSDQRCCVWKDGMWERQDILTRLFHPVQVLF